MLTAYFAHLQDASAGAQIAASLLTALAIGVGPFAVHAIVDHVRVNLRIARQARFGDGPQLALGGR